MSSAPYCNVARVRVAFVVFGNTIAGQTDDNNSQRGFRRHSIELGIGLRNINISLLVYLSDYCYEQYQLDTTYLPIILVNE